MRMIVQRKPIVLPPLTGWVIGWVVLVLVNAFNPKTHSILAALGGFSQQLQFVPFFFFGFALMRSKRRFRQLFIILGVAATAVGLGRCVSGPRLTPGQLSSWGPAIKTYLHPAKGTGPGTFQRRRSQGAPAGTWI